MSKEYNRLMAEKKNDKIFDFDTITYNELKRLWYDESLPDSCIADLYDVKKSQVASKRKKMGINQIDCCLEYTIKKIGQLGISSIYKS